MSETPESEPKPGWPGRKISANVVCPSFETYDALPVVKYELTRAPGLAPLRPRSPA